MACSTDLIDRHQETIAIAVDTEIDQLLCMATGGSLHPKLLSGARPIGHASCLKRLRDGVGIHPGHHQHIARLGVLRDGGDQPGVVVAKCRGIEGHVKNLCKSGGADYLKTGVEKGNVMSAENDLIKLYSARILALAADMPRTARLTNPTATARKRAPLCGSTVTVDLNVVDGVITDYGQDVKACALGQAAAAIVGANIIGLSVEQVQAGRDALFAMLKSDGPVPPAPFAELEVLQPAKDYKNRHASIMLAFDATLDAFNAQAVSA